MPKFQPIIKWSGSKRSQCDEILKHFPKNVKTYYEPFCGGCSVLYALLNSDINVESYICSDLNEDLINLWNAIKEKPQEVYDMYLKLWTELTKDDDVARKRSYFEQQRAEYNRTHSPYIFFFIMRTTTNGMPRYNRKGEFNNSFHITRNGIEPKRLYPILMEWSDKLNENNVIFKHRSYEEILGEVQEGDYVYLDPPYYNAKGMYFDNFDFDAFFCFLKQLRERNIPYALSFDGKSGEIDNTYTLDESLYDEHIYLRSGNSSFKRTTGNDKHAIVYESLYISEANTVMMDG